MRNREPRQIRLFQGSEPLRESVANHSSQHLILLRNPLFPRLIHVEHTRLDQTILDRLNIQTEVHFEKADVPYNELHPYRANLCYFQIISPRVEKLSLPFIRDIVYRRDCSAPGIGVLVGFFEYCAGVDPKRLEGYSFIFLLKITLYAGQIGYPRYMASTRQLQFISGYPGSFQQTDIIVALL